jgi:hypothetical protein
MNGNTNMFVVVITQKPEIAARLCKLKVGERVSPLPGCYTGDDKTNPTWKEWIFLFRRPITIASDRPGSFKKKKTRRS